MEQIKDGTRPRINRLGSLNADPLARVPGAECAEKNFSCQTSAASRFSALPKLAHSVIDLMLRPTACPSQLLPFVVTYAMNRPRKFGSFSKM